MEKLLDTLLDGGCLEIKPRFIVFFREYTFFFFLGLYVSSSELALEEAPENIPAASSLSLVPPILF